MDEENYIKKIKDGELSLDDLDLTTLRTLPPWVLNTIMRMAYRAKNWRILNQSRNIYIKKKFDISDFDSVAENCIPDFIIAGSMKAGTSALYYTLIKHPNIIARELKELHYFTTHANRPIKLYRSMFVDKLGNPDHLIGEASPSYFDVDRPDCPNERTRALIKEHLPNVKIIVLLRDPVRRTISQYYHMQKTGLVPSEEISVDFLKTEAGQTILNTSRYSDRLKRWMDEFGESLLIMDSQELRDREKESLEKIQKFLGLETVIREFETDDNKANKNVYPKPSDDVTDYLSAEFRGYSDEIKELVGVSF